jgi:hypothetical protein
VGNVVGIALSFVARETAFIPNNYPLNSHIKGSCVTGKNAGIFKFQMFDKTGLQATP